MVIIVLLLVAFIGLVIAIYEKFKSVKGGNQSTGGAAAFVGVAVVFFCLILGLYYSYYHDRMCEAKSQYSVINAKIRNRQTYMPYLQEAMNEFSGATDGKLIADFTDVERKGYAKIRELKNYTEGERTEILRLAKSYNRHVDKVIWYGTNNWLFPGQVLSAWKSIEKIEISDDF